LFLDGNWSCKNSFLIFVSGHTLMAEWKHGDFAGAAHRADVGRRGFHCTFCHASYWHAPFHALHAADWVCNADYFLAPSRGLGASRGWFRMATLGLGFSGWIFQCYGRDRVLPRI